MNKIDYGKILREFKPSENEIKIVKSLSNCLIEFINKLARKENINAEAVLVGSVAKGTWLSGKADIDLFIKFPLNTSTDYLKEKGLYLGFETIKKFDGKYEYRYASHPYITGFIKNYEIDFVPCYEIKNSSEIKSAVDRTIPHTKYIKKNLNSEKADQVLLLKQFMQSIGIYGSEFKVGGFAGYLCELLVLYYNSFEEVLQSAANNWKLGYNIDLEEYGTSQSFNEPLIVVDPVDENRNVAAAVNLRRMSEFIVASRNFLKKPSLSYFYPLIIDPDINKLKEEFKRRNTKILLLIFKSPDIPSDALYPQIKKTEKSMVNLMERYDFRIFNSDSWSDEKGLVFILLEFSVWKLPIIKKHSGPQVWFQEHQEKFLEKYKSTAWIQGDRWMAVIDREYPIAESLLELSLTNKNIHYLKFGKHIKNEILKEHELINLIEFLESKTYTNAFLIFLHHYLHKSNVLWR